MSDLVAFLRARLGEDEAEAKATVDADAEFWADVKGDDTYFDRFGPARVLREVEAKRAILDAYTALDADTRLQLGPYPRSHGQWEAYGLAVRYFAAVYRDHEGYRDEWRP